MRRMLIAGNWKMQQDHKSALEAAEQLRDMTSDSELLICPDFLALPEMSRILRGSQVKLGAQDVWTEDRGAFTGEVSAQDLKKFCEYVIVGHSERRIKNHENNELLSKKIVNSLKNSLKIILCVGETLEQRDSKKAEEVIKEELEVCLDGLTSEQMEDVTIAYEPIWAIGTGKTATPKQAEDMHRSIRKIISAMFDENVAQSTRILYGGSVKPENAKDILENEDVDGVLIGGASLKPESFRQIASHSHGQ